jgi:hypothetical protein
VEKMNSIDKAILSTYKTMLCDIKLTLDQINVMHQAALELYVKTLDDYNNYLQSNVQNESESGNGDLLFFGEKSEKSGAKDE